MYSTADPTIFCHPGSYAESFAQKNGDTYVASHNETPIAAVAPTCTATGLTEGKHCPECDVTFVEQEIVPALGHDMQVTTPAVPHTCTQDGKTAIKTCSRCDHTEGGEVDPAAHSYVGQGDGVPATMTESGLTETQICSACGDEIGQMVIPAAPVLTVKAAGPTSLKLSWTNKNVDGYVIKRSTSKNGTYKTVATLEGGVTSYSDTGLKQGKEYFYIINAFNSTRQCTAYSLDSAKKSAKPALIKVTGVKAQSNGYNAAKLTWNCQPGADAYRIYMRTGKKTAAAKLVATVKNPNAKATLSRVVKKLECGTTYYFDVRAFHGGKEGPASKKVAVKPVPAAAKGLKAVAKVGRKVVLSWTKVSGATGYEIYRSSKETSGYKKIDDVTTNKVTLTAQTANRTFFYKIRPYRTVNGKKIYGPYCAPVSCLVKK